MNPSSSEANAQGELVYSCNHCERPIAIDSRAAGLEVACPYCNEKGIVPDGSEDAPANPPPPAITEPHEEAVQGAAEHEQASAAGLPAKRRAGEMPKHEPPPGAPPGPPPPGATTPKREAPSEPEEYEHKGGHGPLPSSGDPIVAGIAKGEIEVLPARRVGRKTVFGCPFCARPIEIKPKAEGKEMDCPECSGKLIAPDLKSGGEALPMSGTGGKAGGVTLPGHHEHADATQRPGGGEADRHPDFKESTKRPVAGDPKSMAAHRLNADKIAKMVPRDEAEAGFHMEEAWATYPDASPIAHAWSSRFKPLLVMGMLGLIAAGIVAGVVLMKRQEAAKDENAGEMAGEVDDGENGGVPDSPAQVVLKTYREFVAADTVAERLNHVRNPGIVEDLMKRFYGRTRNPPAFPALDALTYKEHELGGVSLARIDSVPVEGQSARVFFFEITPSGGAVLDWESAVGYGDIPMKEFTTELPTRAVEMRVLVKRSDYYNHEFADQTVYASYEITDIDRTGVVYGYAVREGAADSTLSQLLPEGAPGWRNCILSLSPHESWERRDPPQLQVDGVVANGWLKL